MADNGLSTVEIELPLDQVTRVRLRDFIGGSSLEIATEREGVELMRFTRAIAPQMSRAYYVLWRLTKESEEDEQHRRRPGGGRQHPLRYPECGRALPRWSKVPRSPRKRGWWTVH